VPWFDFNLTRKKVVSPGRQSQGQVSPGRQSHGHPVNPAVAAIANEERGHHSAPVRLFFGVLIFLSDQNFSFRMLLVDLDVVLFLLDRLLMRVGLQVLWWDLRKCNACRFSST